MPPNKVTSVDVARLVGVSQSTVSRTFSNDTTVAHKTREKVLEAARQLGYTPNALARSLITQQTNLVGIVISHISSSPFQPYTLEKFIQGLQRYGLQALVFSAGPNQEIDDILPVVMQYQVDALIVTTATLSSERLNALVRNGTPVILFNRLMPGENLTAVCCDNVEAGRLVANQFAEAGHKRPAYLAGNKNSSTNRDREKGYMDRLWERGFTRVLREQAQYTYEGGFEAARRLLERDDPPDALFCASDIIAIGALDFMREKGIKVPEEVSIVGFDDIPMASWSAYCLTTVRQPVDQMIDMTLELLTERLKESAIEPIIKLFPCSLVARNTARLTM